MAQDKASSKTNGAFRYDFSSVEDLGVLEDLMPTLEGIKGLREAMAKYTISWPHQHLDCKNPKDYRKLKVAAVNGQPSEWTEAKEKFLEAMQMFLGA